MPDPELPELKSYFAGQGNLEAAANEVLALVSNTKLPPIPSSDGTVNAVGFNPSPNASPAERQRLEALLQRVSQLMEQRLGRAGDAA